MARARSSAGALEQHGGLEGSRAKIGRQRPFTDGGPLEPADLL